ncbi:hypothetical protein BS47DRAFT_257035 [Hydnum rufescens UP504]|uniref:Uncharacterized protein n=1 Tax=Hydnum rufescens UP504 TaxID=1448309 RepID=A0A9P6B6D8_9AGAM|nr:hypothetical protein BS47DRAFT_257035 [Hydnum rufescens UP504]
MTAATAGEVSTAHVAWRRPENTSNIKISATHLVCPISLYRVEIHLDVFVSLDGARIPKQSFQSHCAVPPTEVCLIQGGKVVRELDSCYLLWLSQEVRCNISFGNIFRQGYPRLPTIFRFPIHLWTLPPFQFLSRLHVPTHFYHRIV